MASSQHTLWSDFSFCSFPADRYMKHRQSNVLHPSWQLPYWEILVIDFQVSSLVDQLLAYLEPLSQSCCLIWPISIQHTIEIWKRTSTVQLFSEELRFYRLLLCWEWCYRNNQCIVFCKPICESKTKSFTIPIRDILLAPTWWRIIRVVNKLNGSVDPVQLWLVRGYSLSDSALRQSIRRSEMEKKKKWEMQQSNFKWDNYSDGRRRLDVIWAGICLRNSRLQIVVAFGY